MRIKILDRILVAVAGIILIAGCTGLVCQVFFGKNIIGFTEQQLSRTSTTAKIVIGAIALFLLLLGIYCFLLLFRHHGRKDKFIRQRMEKIRRYHIPDRRIQHPDEKYVCRRPD